MNYHHPPLKETHLQGNGEKNRSGLTQSFDGYVCNGEEGLVIPKSNMSSNGNNMKLPIESSSQFVRTNPKPSIESYYHKHIPMKYAQILRANSDSIFIVAYIPQNIPIIVG